MVVKQVHLQVLCLKVMFASLISLSLDKLVSHQKNNIFHFKDNIEAPPYMAAIMITLFLYQLRQKRTSCESSGVHVYFPL